jgi:hypothetical protein
MVMATIETLRRAVVFVATSTEKDLIDNQRQPALPSQLNNARALPK